MSKHNTGGRAFPRAPTDIGGIDCGGMTLRDWFAGQAMVGILANNRTMVADEPAYYAVAARIAFAAADAMLKARSE